MTDKRFRHGHYSLRQGHQVFIGFALVLNMNNKHLSFCLSLFSCFQSLFFWSNIKFYCFFKWAFVVLTSILMTYWVVIVLWTLSMLDMIHIMVYSIFVALLILMFPNMLELRLCHCHCCPYPSVSILLFDLYCFKEWFTSFNREIYFLILFVMLTF